MPSSRQASFSTVVRWAGEYVPGQVGGRSYTRDLLVEPPGKAPILGSAGARYFGDESRYNPEDLMLASLAECHMLTFLGLSAKAGIRLRSYRVEVTGELGMGGGKMRFLSATLTPRASYEPGTDLARAAALQHEAHEQCFMANSVSFPIEVRLPETPVDSLP